MIIAEMLGLQGLESEDFREDRTARYAGDQVGDRSAAALRMEQIHDRDRASLVDGCPFAARTGDQEQSHREPLQDRRGSAHVLRGEAALLPSQRMVPTHTGDQKYDPQSVHISLNFAQLARKTRSR